MWHLLLPVNRPYLIEGVDRWTQSSVYTEYLIVDNGCKGKVVEDVCAVSPDIDGTILSQTLVIEAINLCNLSALVISPDKGDALRVSHLEGKQEEESLHRVVPSIHEIAHE